MTTSPTQGEHAQTEALRPKFGDLLRNTMASESNPRRDAYFIREVHRSGGGVNPGRWFEMTDGKGEKWLSNPQNMVPATPAQPAAPQGVAYAELPKDVIRAVFIENGFTVKEGQPDLKQYVYDAANELLRRARLRASNGQAPAGAADEMAINRPAEDSALPFNQWRGEMQSALERAGVYAARSPGAGNKLTLRWRATRDDVLPAPTAQAAPAHFGDEAHVAIPRMLLGAACSAIDKKRDGTKVLAELRRYTTGDLSKAIEPAAGAVAEPSAITASVMRDDGGEQPAFCLMVAYRSEKDAMDALAMLVAAPTPAAQADSVLEDAARYRHLRDCNSGSLAVMQITGTGEDDWCILTEDAADAAIDAARKQGGTHD